MMANAKGLKMSCIALSQNSGSKSKRDTSRKSEREVGTRAIKSPVENSPATLESESLLLDHMKRVYANLGADLETRSWTAWACL